LNQENPDKYLKKSQFFRVEDSLGVYLLYIDEFKKGETAPRIILESTIKNIIRNQRKLKFTKQFEKDIIQDAIKSKTYETISIIFFADYFIIQAQEELASRIKIDGVSL